MSPGGGCEATAGLACVCPDRRAPARPLMGKACGQTSGSGTGKHPEHHRGPWIPALPHAGRPRTPLPARHSGKGRRNVQRCGQGSRKGWSHGRIGHWAPLQGLGRVGGHTAWGLQPLGKGLSSISWCRWHSLGITCLREDRVDTAPGQHKGLPRDFQPCCHGKPLTGH